MTTLDSETFAVLLTFAVDIGVASIIVLGFFIYRKWRGDKLVAKSVSA